MDDAEKDKVAKREEKGENKCLVVRLLLALGSMP